MPRQVNIPTIDSRNAGFRLESAAGHGVSTTSGASQTSTDITRFHKHTLLPRLGGKTKRSPETTTRVERRTNSHRSPLFPITTESQPTTRPRPKQTPFPPARPIISGPTPSHTRCPTNPVARSHSPPNNANPRRSPSNLSPRPQDREGTPSPWTRHSVQATSRPEETMPCIPSNPSIAAILRPRPHPVSHTHEYSNISAQGKKVAVQGQSARKPLPTAIFGDPPLSPPSARRLGAGGPDVSRQGPNSQRAVLRTGGKG